MTSSSSSTFQVTADVLSEFLEVAVHCILYTRGLYPAGVFERKKKYNVPVQICVHPDVSKYITNVVDGIKVLLSSNDAEKVVVVVLGNKMEPLERFVFELTSLHIRNPKGDDEYLLRVEQSLRAFLLKLNICDSMLADLPDDCTWVVQVHTKESGAQKLEDHQTLRSFPWTEAEESQISVVDGNIVPLKSMMSDIANMQLYVEEKALKT